MPLQAGRINRDTPVNGRLRSMPVVCRRQHLAEPRRLSGDTAVQTLPLQDTPCNERGGMPRHAAGFPGRDGVALRGAIPGQAARLDAPASLGLDHRGAGPGELVNHAPCPPRARTSHPCQPGRAWWTGVA
jgi:hypothetical protein